MGIDYKDPIVFSIIAGNITLFVTIVVFILTKPNMVMKIKEDHTHGLDLFKAITLSLIMGLATSLVTFLIKVRNRIGLPVTKQVKMEFSNNY